MVASHLRIYTEGEHAELANPALCPFVRERSEPAGVRVLSVRERVDGIIGKVSRGTNWNTVSISARIRNTSPGILVSKGMLGSISCKRRMTAGKHLFR